MSFQARKCMERALARGVALPACRSLQGAEAVSLRDPRPDSACSDRRAPVATALRERTSCANSSQFPEAGRADASAPSAAPRETLGASQGGSPPPPLPSPPSPFRPTAAQNLITLVPAWRSGAYRPCDRLAALPPQLQLRRALGGGGTGVLDVHAPLPSRFPTPAHQAGASQRQPGLLGAPFATGGSHVATPAWHGGGRVIPSRAASSTKAGGAAKKGRGPPAAVVERTSRDVLLESALKGEPVQQDDRDEAQLAADEARAKEYSSLMMKAHRAQQRAETLRLTYKLAAIAAVPPGKLRDAAQAPDYTPFPKHMLAPSLTPPVERDAEEAAAARAKPVKKLR